MMITAGPIRRRNKKTMRILKTRKYEKDRNRLGLFDDRKDMKCYLSGPKPRHLLCRTRMEK